MSVWDDPRMARDESDRFRFDTIGDRVKGRLTSVEVFEGPNGTAWHIKLADVTYRQGNDDGRQDKGEYLAGAKSLKAQLLALKPSPGDQLDVQLIDLQKAGQGTAKIFAVSATAALPMTVVHAIGETERPADAPAPVTAPDDLFG